MRAPIPIEVALTFFSTPITFLIFHFHMLFLDGIYIDDKNHRPRFIPITQPKTEDIFHLTHKISLRIGKYLERCGLIERDTENSYLNEDILPNNDMGEHQSHSINYKIAIGPQKGKKVFRLQTIEPRIEEPSADLVCKLSGFSLHAGVCIKANQREKLERLCRYIARPAVSNQRLSLTPTGRICYALKTPYRDGTTHVFLSLWILSQNWLR